MSTDKVKQYNQTYYHKNHEVLTAKSKEYYYEHKDEDQQRFYDRYKNNPQFKLRCNKRSWLSRMVRMMVRGIKAGKIVNLDKRDVTMIDLTGMTCYEFLVHLMSTIPIGYTIADYGKSGCLEIDHIQPLVSFNLLNPSELKAAFHYSNTRLVLASHNRTRARTLAGTGLAIGQDDL